MATDVIARHLQWMNDRGLAKSYISVRRQRLRQLAELLGKPVTEATEEDLLAWRSGLDVGPDSVRVTVTHIREFYKWLADQGYKRTDPARRIPRPKPTRRLPRPIEQPTLTAALDTAPDPAVRLMLAIAGWAGLRSCELAGLRWESIRLSDGWLLVTAETAKCRRERVVQLSLAHR